MADDLNILEELDGIQQAGLAALAGAPDHADQREPPQPRGQRSEKISGRADGKALLRRWCRCCSGIRATEEVVPGLTLDAAASTD